MVVPRILLVLKKRKNTHRTPEIVLHIRPSVGIGEANGEALRRRKKDTGSSGAELGRSDCLVGVRFCGDWSALQARMKAKAEKTQKFYENKARGPKCAADGIEDQLTNLALEKDANAASSPEGNSQEEVAEEWTPHEAIALKKLLSADARSGSAKQSPDRENGQQNGAGDATNADESCGGAQGEGEEADGAPKTGGKSSDRHHPRLERQVFVGGLPVNVTSALFRAWADQVFNGRVINAVLVRRLSFRDAGHCIPSPSAAFLIIVLFCSYIAAIQTGCGSAHALKVTRVWIYYF